MLRLVLTLADEPTGELYSASGQRILVLFRQIVEQEQTTILVAAHDLMVDTFADEVYRLQDGRIVSSAFSPP